MFEQVGRVAIVTGASSGIGRAIALGLGRLGGDVVIADIDREAAARVAESIAALGCRSLAVEVDVTRRAQVEACVQQVIDTFGRIDVLVNNAGGAAGIPITHSIEEVTDEHWDAIIDRNLRSTFLMCRAVVPHMLTRQWGRIVNISSGAGRSYSGAYAARLQYASAKAGQLGLTRQLARDLAPHGITVNAVAPALTRTSERLEEAWAALGPEGQRARLVNTPIGRRAETEEIAAAALFLASAEASYVVGACIDVNGGQIMQ